tara:strand:+ start:1677 stop:2084 length:408 start_codon:yes stop_codon:yes gene_type:complete
MNKDFAIIIFSYSINPFIRKYAIINLNKPTAAALLQFSNILIYSLYLYNKKKDINIEKITIFKFNYSLISNILTLLSTISVNNLLVNKKISNSMTYVQALTIVSSNIIDIYINSNTKSKKQIIGLFLIIFGIICM